MKEDINVICVDVGRYSDEERRNNFGWAYRKFSVNNIQTGTSIYELIEIIAEIISNNSKLCLGFECPLWLPLSEDPSNLTKKRAQEGNRPWSAAAGACAMSVGIVQASWIFSKIKEKLPNKTINSYFDWNNFLNSSDGVYIWEAFVTGKAHAATHVEDAENAVKAFIKINSAKDAKSEDLIQSKNIPIIAFLLKMANWQISASEIIVTPQIVVAENID